MSSPLVIAHRGASGYEPENSRAAFRAAKRYGAHGVELDIRPTVDGTLLVVHDPLLAGQRIEMIPADVARAAPLANGELIPTLPEALDAIDPHLLVFIEVKALPAVFDDTLFRLLEAGPAPEHYQVHSFDHRIIERLGSKRPTLPRGVLSVSRPLRPAAALRDTGADTLWQEHSLIDASMVEAIHDAEARIFAWTVDAPDDIARVATLGVDGICTNYPDVVLEALEHANQR